VPSKKLGGATAPVAAVDALVLRREQRSASLGSFFLYQPQPGVPAPWQNPPPPRLASRSKPLSFFAFFVHFVVKPSAPFPLSRFPAFRFLSPFFRPEPRACLVPFRFPFLKISAFSLQP